MCAADSAEQIRRGEPRSSFSPRATMSAASSETGHYSCGPRTRRRRAIGRPLAAWSGLITPPTLSWRILCDERQRPTLRPQRPRRLTRSRFVHSAALIQRARAPAWRLWTRSAAAEVEAGSEGAASLVRRLCRAHSSEPRFRPTYRRVPRRRDREATAPVPIGAQAGRRSPKSRVGVGHRPVSRIVAPGV
jgi:hypothetical protein